MSIKVNDIADNLVNAIQESEEYKSFEKAKESLQKESDLMHKVQEFRKQQFEMQLNQRNGMEPDDFSLMNIQNTYSSLMTIPSAAAYLNAVYDLSKMISRLYEIIGNAVDLDLDFMNQ